MQNAEKSDHSRLCVTGDVNSHYDQDPQPYTRHWVPFRMYEGILFDFQLPLREDVGLPHSVAHRKVDGVISPPLCHAIQSPCRPPKADRYNTGSTGDLCCFRILSGRQVGYLAKSHVNYMWAAEMSPLCNISNSHADMPDTMGCWRWNQAYVSGQVNLSLVLTFGWAESLSRLHVLHWLDLPELSWAQFSYLNIGIYWDALGPLRH